MLSSLSQSHLSLLATCPRKFQHLYLDRVMPPQSWHQNQRALWGTQFHQLMQQLELGLPIDRLRETQPDLFLGIEALRSAAPQLFQAPNPAQGEWQASEHRRSLAFSPPAAHDKATDPMGLLVVYDWIRGNPEFVEIFDWKTYRQPPQSQKLAQHWQTRLYCYVLAETSDYQPQHIRFSYWFVAPPQAGEPVQARSLSFQYNQALHDQTHQDLCDLIQNFQDWVTAYQTESVQFPQVPEGDRACQFCGFQQRCQRVSGGEEGQDWQQRREQEPDKGWTQDLTQDWAQNSQSVELLDGQSLQAQQQLQELLHIAEIPALPWPWEESSSARL
ncbi:MAG: PD-(D/E)XK nuclease family protein [Prochlorothrix sp.]